MTPKPIDFARAFSGRDNAGLFALPKDTDIPAHCQSALRPSGPTVACKPSHQVMIAVCRLLCGAVGVGTVTGGFDVTVKGSSTPDFQVTLQAGVLRYRGAKVNDAWMPYLSVLLYALIHEPGSEPAVRFLSLCDTLQGPLFYDKQALLQASALPDVAEGMMQVCDSVYCYARFTFSGLELEQAPVDLGRTSTDGARQIIEAARQARTVKPPTAPLAEDDPASPRALLLRQLPRGNVRALLHGKTGAGKTRLVYGLAGKLGLRLLMVYGSEGLEDRDLIGKITPAGWVDGVITTAFRLAGQGVRTLVFIDELFRIPRHHQNLLVGALNVTPHQALRSMTGDPGIPAGDYYVLPLHDTGELLFAPVTLIQFVCATNAGAQYAVEQDVDPALLRRFNTVLHIQPPNEAATVAELVRCGLQPEIAQACTRVQGRTTAEAASQQSLFCMPGNPGTTLEYARHVQDLMDCGVPFAAAMVRAARYGLAPQLTRLTDDGELDELAVDALDVLIGEVVAQAGPVTRQTPSA
jgi:AAA domain (dynein-related subfamily)